jgi:hypothetical protein
MRSQMQCVAPLGAFIWESGLTNSMDFAEIHRKSVDSVGTELKNVELLFTNPKFQKKSRKYYKN